MSFRVKIISPLKATAEDLARRQRRYAEIAGPDTTVEVLNLESGPLALNSSGDILTSAAAVYHSGQALSPTTCDAILIDCVFDPAVDELREATGIPTFGPTRTTLPLIDLVANRFSIVARTWRQCELLAELVQREGYGHRLGSLRALDISYAEAKQPEVFKHAMLQQLEQLAREDEADAVMFGSTTMALTDELRAAADYKPLFMPGMVALRLMRQLWHDRLWLRK